MTYGMRARTGDDVTCAIACHETSSKVTNKLFEITIERRDTASRMISLFLSRQHASNYMQFDLIYGPLNDLELRKIFFNFILRGKKGHFRYFLTRGACLWL